MILEQPDKTLQGKCVSVFTEETTLERILKAWSKVKGKKAHYVEVNKETFLSLWSHAGIDMVATMMEFHQFMEKNPWSGGGDILTKDDLGVKGLMDVEQSFASLNI